MHYPEVLCRVDDVGVQSEGVVEHGGERLGGHRVVVTVGRCHLGLFFGSFLASRVGTVSLTGQISVTGQRPVFDCGHTVIWPSRI